MYRIQARFIECRHLMPDDFYWFRWGHTYATLADAFNALRDMKRHWKQLKLRIIHFYE